MKKYFSILMSAVMLLLASCTQDDLNNLPLGQEMNTKVSMQLPAMQRAAHEDPNVDADNQLRVFLIVSHDGKVVDVQEKTTSALTVNFDVRLVTGQAYDLAAWADFGDNYYTVEDAVVGAAAPSVKMVLPAEGESLNGSDNKRDAYFAIMNDFSLTESKPISMTLKRPFGLINIKTLDYNEPAVVNTESLPTHYATTITMPTAFSLVSGETMGDAEAVNISAPVLSNWAEAGVTGELSYDYIFASDAKSLINFTMNYTKSDAPLVSYDFKDIPLQRNYKTNISGNILTKQGTVTIEIDQMWEGEYNENIAPNALQAAVNDVPSANVDEVVIVVSSPIQNGDLDNNTLYMPTTAKNITLVVSDIETRINIVNADGAQYTGQLTLQLTDADATMGNVDIDLPNATILWAAETYERLQAVLGMTENCDGVRLVTDIKDMQGNSIECIRISREGFIFDGNGYEISGNATQNIMVVTAEDVVVKNLEIYQPASGAASHGVTVYSVTGVKLDNVTIHDCRKAGMVVNGAEVTATGLHTYNNAWGAVNVGKGSGVTETPVFTFDQTCQLEEDNKVWVDCEEPWTVNAPQGWWSYTVGGMTIYTNKPVEPGTVTNLEELKAALPALAENGGKLTIAGNFEIKELPALEIQKPTTLVILGKITCEDENFYLLNKSELTIEATGTVKFKRRVVENHGKLTVTGGTYYTNTNNGGTAFWNNNEAAEMVLNDVTTYASFFAVAGNGKFEINGGLITSISSNKYGSWAYCVRAGASSEMVINDATVQGVQGAIACIESSKITLNNVKAIAKNSEPGKQDAFYALYAASLGVIEVNSGEFYSDRTPCCYASDDDQEGDPYGAFVLKGGKYSSMPKNHGGSDWWAEEGYKFVETGDSTYPYEIVPDTQG